MAILKRKTGKNKETFNLTETEKGRVTMPKIVMLSPKMLKVDESYQRKLDKRRAKEINDEFDPDLFGILVVSERDGNFFVVDGRHRLCAVADFLSEVPCALWQGLTYEEECVKFRKLNSNRKGLNASVIFHETVCEGDKNAVRVANILKVFGFSYNRDNQTTRNNVIGSPKRMLDIFISDGERALQRLLFINRRAWHGNKESLTATMLVGLNTFLTENKNINDEYVIKALEKIDPKLIKAQASYYVTADNISGISGGSSRYIHIANAIKSIYNKSVPKNARIV